MPTRHHKPQLFAYLFSLHLNALLFHKRKHDDLLFETFDAVVKVFCLVMVKELSKQGQIDNVNRASCSSDSALSVRWIKKMQQQSWYAVMLYK